jgi:hypothetical protein
MPEASLVLREKSGAFEPTESAIIFRWRYPRGIAPEINYKKQAPRVNG